MLHQPTGRKGRSPQRHKYPQECHRIVPSSSEPSRPSGVTNVGPTTAIATHTHNLAEPLCPNGSQHHWQLAVYQAPTSRQCGHARRRSTSTPRGQAQTTHTQPTQSRCVPFSDPHVHKVARSNDTRQECTHSSAKAMGTSQPSGEDTPDDDQSKGMKKKGVHQQRVLC